jgi:hypothetical protein
MVLVFLNLANIHDIDQANPIEVISVFHQPSDLVSAGLGVGAAFAFGPMRR